MAFLGLWNKFNKRRTSRKHYKKTPAPPLTPPMPTKVSKVTPDKQSLNVSGSRLNSAAILIVYRDETKQDLCAPLLIYGQKNSPLHVEFKKFKNYDLIHIDGFTTTFADNYGMMTLTYRAKDAGVIWIFCRDIDDFHLLQEPRLISGKMADSYAIVSPEITGYTLLRATGHPRGIFSKKQKTTTFFYRKKNWVKVIYEQKYLQMNDFIQCFATPNGKLLKITLAKETIWQTFESIQLADKTWWHCMGGNIWIKETPNAFTEVLTNKKPSKKTPEFLTDKVAYQAIIDYVPHKKLTTYDQPFGKPLTKILDQTKVTLTQSVLIHGLTWYQIADSGWVIKQYLKF